MKYLKTFEKKKFSITGYRQKFSDDIMDICYELNDLGLWVEFSNFSVYSSNFRAVYKPEKSTPCLRIHPTTVIRGRWYDSRNRDFLFDEDVKDSLLRLKDYLKGRYLGFMYTTGDPFIDSKYKAIHLTEDIEIDALLTGCIILYSSPKIKI